MGGKLTGEIYSVRFDQLNETVKLIGGNEGVNRITEQNQVCLFQFCPQRGKVLFIASDALPHRQEGEGMLRMESLQVEGGMYCCGIFSLWGWRSKQESLWLFLQFRKKTSVPLYLKTGRVDAVL